MKNTQDHEFIRAFVREHSAIILGEDKDYLIDTRLRSVCRTHDLAGLPALVATLRHRPVGPMAREVIEALTTNETRFFRDAGVFDALRGSILPELLERRKQSKRLAIWCAAASTGQEPYSVAMVCSEVSASSDYRIKIDATDIDQRVLNRARDAVYSRHEVARGVASDRLERYFDAEGSSWKICAQVRNAVNFRELNLASPWPSNLGPYDIILLRNVLIYFDNPTKMDILARAQDRLRPDGVLLLGSSETTINLSDAYVPVSDGRSVVYRLAA
ncbi:MAG: protein-glutamate O-methyltransferase CheR [Myxococcota bacterium]